MEMSGSSCLARGQPPRPLLRLLALPLPCEENHQIKINMNPENVNKNRLSYSYAYDHDLDSADFQLHDVVCLWFREGVHAPFFLTSQTSATRHQWLSLVSSRRECYTRAVSLTRTRFVSCILLTYLTLENFLPEAWGVRKFSVLFSRTKNTIFVSFIAFSQRNLLLF